MLPIRRPDGTEFERDWLMEMHLNKIRAQIRHSRRTCTELRLWREQREYHAPGLRREEGLVYITASEMELVLLDTIPSRIARMEHAAIKVES